MQKTLLIILSGLLLSLGACNKEDTDSKPDKSPFDSYEMLSSQSQDGYELRIYGKQAYFSGYNQLYFDVIRESSNESLADFSVEINPIMNMGDYSHSCPVEQPKTNSEGILEGAVIFQMPSMKGSWKLKTRVNAENKAIDFDLDVQVANPEYSRTHVITSPIDSTKLMLSFVEPDEFKVGDNRFEMTMHRMENMMTFAPVEDYTLEIEPEMPSMGHGSKGNIHPEHESKGHYVGNVSFNMTGDWRINVDVFKGDQAVSQDKLYFDLYFQN